MQVLSLEQIQHKAPSVFAMQPWGGTSRKYRFFPTCDVVKGLMENGFLPVAAGQSRTRIEGKEGFTRHVLRFRHADMGKHLEVGQEIPEIVLLNSHDGTSSYRLMLGMYRLVCSNGMVVKSHDINEISVRHSGREDIVNEVIEGSYKVIDEAPKAIAQIQDWRSKKLDRTQQEAFAESALVLRDTSLQISSSSILHARRRADMTDQDGRRDLWTTLNVVQESFIRGGVRGRNANGGRASLRAVTSVDTDTKLNRALWILAERLGQAV